MSRKAQERFWYGTPDHLWDAARAICAELNREYPYLAEFHLEDDGSYRLCGMHTIERSISRHDGKEYIGRTGWGVDWIERDQQYAYHQSSGGGSLRHEVSGIYWRHPAMLHMVREQTARYVGREFRKRNKTRRIRRIPIDLDGQPDLMQFLENRASETEVYYCSVCLQYLPDDDQCGHVWSCDDGIKRGPGGEITEPCDDEDCWDCSRARERVSV